MVGDNERERPDYMDSGRLGRGCILFSLQCCGEQKLIVCFGTNLAARRKLF